MFPLHSLCKFDTKKIASCKDVQILGGTSQSFLGFLHSDFKHKLAQNTHNLTCADFRTSQISPCTGCANLTQKKLLRAQTCKPKNPAAHVFCTNLHKCKNMHAEAWFRIDRSVLGASLYSNHLQLLCSSSHFPYSIPHTKATYCHDSGSNSQRHL